MNKSQEPSRWLKKLIAAPRRAALPALLAAAVLNAAVLAAPASGQVAVRFSDAEGVTPAEAMVRAGAVTIAVQNQSSTARLTLRITREDGERVMDIPVPEGAASWSTQVELAAGRYALTEANTRGWVCRLTVQ
jgi:uncharacterized cupredoxin-like copper-binding protein